MIHLVEDYLMFNPEEKSEMLGLRFHHVGVACRDLDREERTLSCLGYHLEGADFVDTTQGVAGRFLGGQEPRMELLRPLGEGGVLRPWLNSGAKMYHLAYETTSLLDSVTALRAQRAKLVVEPVAAVAFGMRHIAFLMLPNMLLIELIQREV